MVEEFRIK